MTKEFRESKQYDQWKKNGVFYFTRMNKNGTYAILNQTSQEESCETGVQIDADKALEYCCPHTQTYGCTRARIITYIDPALGKKLLFLANLVNLSALTVYMLYKNKWVLGPLFKRIKQNLEHTYFLPESEQGIKKRTCFALILNLIFSVVHKMTRRAEDFAIMVKLAAKNTGGYVGLAKFLQLSQRELINALDTIEKVQLERLVKIRGLVFRPPLKSALSPPIS